MAVLNESRAQRDTERIEERIAAKRAEIDSLYALRKENWRSLEACDVSRAKMAKWSGVDPIMVTRALGPKE
jgi:hypothetical protein